MKLVVEHLESLIRLKSVSSVSNRPVVEYAAAALRMAGWSFRELAYLDDAGVEKVNLIAAPPGQDAATRDVDLAFVCHTDTVPYQRGWRDALVPHLSNGTLHGCGACDVKGFLACLLAAAKAGEGKSVARLRILLTADEETGCNGAKRLLQGDMIRARRMVIGEPTSLHVARAGKGYCLARFTLRGREAHSAHPAQGKSAISAAARLIAALEMLSEELKQQTNELFSPPFTTLNVGTIAGGTAKNVVPGYCDFLLEWRPVPGGTGDPVLKAIHSLVAQVSLNDPGITYTVDLLRQQPGFETPASSSLVQFFEQATGRSATSIPFGSEASVFPSVTEEIVVFGPGDMRTAHSERECVPVAELDEAAAVIVQLMTQG